MDIEVRVSTSPNLQSLGKIKVGALHEGGPPRGPVFEPRGRQKNDPSRNAGLRVERSGGGPGAAHWTNRDIGGVGAKGREEVGGGEEGGGSRFEDR